ncbi:conserved hypothetical protein [Paraburkholderia sacchari]|uniref:hypothetical protein n=1 Tax=Paraburkholderia sacchari TaxID=159450 RepID=UPI0039A69E34
MSISETGATSSNYGYDDPYSTANQANPPDASANKNENNNNENNNDSGSGNAPDSTAHEGAAGETSPTATGEDSGGGADQAPDATNQQKEAGGENTKPAFNEADDGSGGDAEKSPGITKQEKPQDNGVAAGAMGDDVKQGENGQGGSSGVPGAKPPQVDTGATAPGPQSSQGKEGASGFDNGGGNDPAAANAVPNHITGNAGHPAQTDTQRSNVGGSGQAVPPLGTQGGKADALPPTGLAAGEGGAQGSNAKAQDHAAPPLGTQGGNPPPLLPQSPNAGQPVTPGAVGSADPAHGSQRSGLAGDAGKQGENGQGGAPDATGGKPLQADASNPSPATGYPAQAAGTQNGNMGGSRHVGAPGGAHGDHQNKGIVSKPHAAVHPGGDSSGVAPNPPGGQLSPNEAPAANKPVLPGATESELNGLLNKYDTQIDGRNQDSRNRLNDANTAEKINAATDFDYTGYPQDVRNFENQLSSSRGQLAALQPEMRDYYTGQLAALDTAYRNINSPDARANLNEKATKIENEILAEYNQAINNPLDRTMAIFNHPVGEGYLGKDFNAQIKHLEQLRAQFLNAPDAEHRDAFFAQATQLKTQLQQGAARGVDDYLAKDRAAWGEANNYVDKLIADAQTNQDPAKRYKSIGDGLFSLNSGMGEDDVADRRVLAFTQRMMDDPDLRQKLDAWQFDAGKPLNADGASAAQPYSQIVNDLPPAGPDYVRDLADRYTNVIRSQTDGERIAAFNRAKPYVQAAEGFARFMLGLTPLAPLTMVMDGASTLSPMARLGIDIGSGVASVAAGPVLGGISGAAKGAGRFLSELKAGAAAANESMQDMKLDVSAGKVVPVAEQDGKSSTAIDAAKAETSTSHLLERNPGAVNQEGDMAQDAYKPAELGPSPDPRMLEARTRIEQNPMDVPSRYAVDVDGRTLKADENAPGVFDDGNGQRYVRSGDQYFKAKYDSYNDTWRAVHPESPNAFSYPIRYDPQGGTWSVHGDVGGPGGGGLSKLVSLAKYAKSDPRIADLMKSKILKPQDPQTCFLDHGRVAQHAAGVPDGRLVPISSGALNANQLSAELDKGPVVLSARNIARPDSNYSGMHTVVLLKKVREDGGDYVLGVDLDDTVGRNGQAQNPGDGDFGGIRYDLNQLVNQATPYVDEDTGTQLEMYSRPQQKGGFWNWFKPGN